MLRLIRNKTIRKIQGQSFLEYLFLLTLILFTFLVFQKYITRGFSGRWKGSGDMIGAGRIYDRTLTTECAYDFEYTLDWYLLSCYDSSNCDRDCKTIYGNVTACTSCISGCSVAPCI